MSRRGLRKLYFGLKSTIFMRYYAVNRTCLSARLAYGKMTFTSVTLMSGLYGGFIQNPGFIPGIV